jgi:uncharacterized protein
MKTPRFAPQFSIEINGSPIPTALRACITTVRLQTGMKGSDRLEFGLFNENLRWLDDELLRPGNRVALSMGYAPDLLPLMFAGELVGIEASFPSSGTPTLQLAAQDALAEMQKGQQTRWFARQVPNATNLPLSRQEVIRSVLAEYGMQPQFDAEDGDLAAIIGSLASLLATGLSLDDPSVPQRGIDLQVTSHDYDLLKKIAGELGYDLFLDHSGATRGIVLLFGPWRNLVPAVELHYGRSLQEFTPRESDAGQATEVTANVWVSSQKLTINLTLGWNWEAMVFTLRAEQGKAEAGKKSKSLVIDEPLTLATAPRRLVAELLPKLNSRTTASGAAVGDVRIRPGAVMKITGVGERFGGFYRVTECSHSLDGSGYRTQFDVRKEVWFNIPKTDQGAVKVRLPAPLGKALSR